jgi:uncharacterized membrane protein YjjP (DUF1212 family)
VGVGHQTSKPLTLQRPQVVHDVISVDDASREIDRLMTTKPIYGLWPTLFIGGMCSAFICCM